MFAICCVKSKTTYNRIINMFPSFEWEEYFFSIDDVRERLVFSEYNFAVVDNELHYSSDLIGLFNAKNIPVIYFEKDFGKLEDELKGWQAKMISEKTKHDEVSPDTVENAEYKSNVKIVQKVVEKVVEVPVYKPMYSPLQRRVGIFSLSERAGSSFLVTNLAKALSSRNISVSVIELPYETPYLFDTVGMINSIDADENKYVSFQHLISEGFRELDRNKVIIVDDISWVLVDPQLARIKPEKWNLDKTMLLLDIARDSAVSIMDAGYSVPESDIKGIMNVIDMAYVVVDCVPADIMGNLSRLKLFTQLKKEGKQVFFIINKFNSGINKKQLLSFMNVEPLAYVPCISPDYIYSCFYTAKIPYEKKEVKDILDPCFSSIISKIVPPDFLPKTPGEVKKNVKKGLLGGLLKKGDKEIEQD